MSIAPIAEAAMYCVRGLGRKKWKAHERAFHLFVEYCITPPVTPYWKPEREYLTGRSRPNRPQLCIACGRVHITSEECGTERPERTFRNSVPRRHDGYSLQRAANMGCFADADNWE